MILGAGVEPEPGPSAHIQLIVVVAVVLGADAGVRRRA